MSRIDVKTLLGTVFFLAMTFEVSGLQPPDCTAPPLSPEQVKAIVDKERKARKDLPAAHPEQRWAVRRQGCHYIYTETAVPERPDQINLFWLNQHGQIVDTRPGTMTCPEKAFTLDELAAIVKAERAKRQDLPPPFGKARTAVSRTRCLYVFSEFDDGGATGSYQVFTIDPFGEVMDVFRGKTPQEQP